MAETTVTSKKFSWNQLDFLKSALVFFITGVVTTIAASIDAGHFPTGTEWLAALKVAGLATVSYLIKQFLTPAVRQTPAE